MTSEFVRPSLVARLLGIHRQRVYEMIHDGTLQSISLGPRRLLVKRSSLAGLLREEASRLELFPEATEEVCRFLDPGGAATSSTRGGSSPPG